MKEEGWRGKQSRTTTRRLLDTGGYCSTLKKLATEPSAPSASDMISYYRHPILSMMGGNGGQIYIYIYIYIYTRIKN